MRVIIVGYSWVATFSIADISIAFIRHVEYTLYLRPLAKHEEKFTTRCSFDVTIGSKSNYSRLNIVLNWE